MEQLSALDSIFLHTEANNAPMHVGSLSIFDQSTIPGGGVIRFKDIISRTQEVAHLVPYVRRRVVDVPFNMDFPYWVEDEDFDPEYHIRHVALPAPGDWRQLCILAARLHAIPLDRSRPLWEIWVIEGLNHVEGVPSGSFAILQKIHHACVDGRSVADIGSVIADPTPETRPIEPAREWKPERMPSSYELMMRAQKNMLLQPKRSFDVAKQSLPRLPNTLKGLLKGELKLPGSATRTRFNTPVSKQRVVDSKTWEFSRIRAVKEQAGVTINDAVLGIVSGALRRYLLDKDDLPEESLVTMCPINVRESSKLARGGNQVTTMFVPLRTEVEDAKARLIEIANETRNSKALTEALGAKEMVDSTNLMSSRRTASAARLASRAAQSNTGRISFNTVTTNVPGPQAPLYFLGAEMITRQIGLGIVQDGIGLFHSIASYNGSLTISICACRDLMPDPAFYIECLDESLKELEDAFTKKKTRARRKAAKAKPKRKQTKK